MTIGNKNIVQLMLITPCTILLFEGESTRDRTSSSPYVTKIIWLDFFFFFLIAGFAPLASNFESKNKLKSPAKTTFFSKVTSKK